MEGTIMSFIRNSALLLVTSSLSMNAYQGLIQLKASTKSGASDPHTIIQKHIQDKAVVLFYKPSCPFCVYLDGKFKTLAHQNTNNAQFIMIDIQQKDVIYKSNYSFSTVPTVVYFKNGKQVASHGSDNKTITLQTMQQKVDLLK